MALYELLKDSISSINETTFASQDVGERTHLQRLLKSRPDVIAPDTLIIAEEFCEWVDSKRKIDLLGVDTDANLVVIELKRTEDGAHMELQAIRYAAMVSAMRFSQAVDIYKRYLEQNQRTEDAEQSLLQFLGWGEPNEEIFGQEVRIVLVSAEFSKEITTSVLWLNDHDLDIRCVRLRPHELDGRLILDVQRIIPLPEAESYQVQIKKKSEENRQAKRSQGDWESILADCKNSAVVAFFRKRLNAGQHSRISHKILVFSEANERQGWNVQIQKKKNCAHVLQKGRFEGDVEFWSKKMSQPEDVHVRKTDSGKLLFDLHTEADVDAFEQVMDTEASSIILSQSGTGDADD